MTAGTDLTILLALAAGLLSFLSPCVLPLVPAYLGQLTAVAVAGRRATPPPSRWLAVRHAFAYVAGFGAVFTLLGVTATYAAAGLAAYIPTLRVVGGLILIVLGLNLAGILRIGALERTWRPLDAGAAGNLATTTGSIALGTPGSAGGTARPRRSTRWPARRHERRLARVLRPRRDLRDRLDAVHRHHPRRDPDDGDDVRHRGPGRASCSSPTAWASGSRSSRSRSPTTERPPSSARSSAMGGSCRSSVGCSWR